jgi:hypothetical protein
MLFIRGNAMSGAPIMIGTNQLPKPPIMAGMTMKKIISRPCAVTNTLYMCLPASIADALVNAVHHLGKTMEILDSRLLQLHAHEDGQNATDKAGEDGEPKVHRADVLVVGGEQVALDPRRVIIMRIVRCCALAIRAFLATLQLFGLAEASSASLPLRCRAAVSSFCASSTSSLAFSAQALNSSSDTTRTVIGMNAWSLPHSSEHWP